MNGHVGNVTHERSRRSSEASSAFRLNKFFSQAYASFRAVAREMLQD